MQGVEGGFEGTFTTLYGCLFEDRNCRTFLGKGTALGTPPQLLHQHLQGVKRAGVCEGGGELLREGGARARAEGAEAGDGPRAGTLPPRQEGVRAVEVPVHPRGWVHDLPAVEPGQQGDHGTVEEGVGFEPRDSGGGNGDGGNSSGEGSASEAAGGGRGGELTIPVWWPPSSGDVQRERSARRGGSAGVARAASAATRERGAREAQARSGRGALGLRGTGKEELPEG